MTLTDLPTSEQTTSSSTAGADSTHALGTARVKRGMAEML